MAEENIGGKKRLIGEVLPSKMEKTIVVAVKNYKTHPEIGRAHV